MRYTRWAKGSECWRNKLNDVKSGREEMKNSMYASISWSAKTFLKRTNLAGTCFFDSFMPVSFLFTSFGWLSNMDFIPSYSNPRNFPTISLSCSKAPRKATVLKITKWHCSTFTNKLNIFFQNSLSLRTSFEVVVNMYLVFFHIKFGNICKRFSSFTWSNINKVKIITRNKNWFVFIQSSLPDRITLADICVSVAEQETYAIGPRNLLFFQGLVDNIEQDLTRRTVFTCCCVHTEKTKIDGSTTIVVKN